MGVSRAIFFPNMATEDKMDRILATLERIDARVERIEARVTALEVNKASQNVATLSLGTFASGCDFAERFMSALYGEWQKKAAKQPYLDSFQPQDTPSVFEIWAACSRLDEKHPLYLPPFYGTSECTDLCERIDRLLKSTPSKLAGSGGNIILKGVKGVGKSTMLRMAAIVGLLRNNLLTAFWDYEKSSGQCVTPGAALQAALVKSSSAADASAPIQFSLSALSPPSLPSIAPTFTGILFIGDEINSVYVKREEARARCDRGVSIISEVLALGKSAHTTVLLSGSTSLLSSMVFCERESEWACLGYRNLNHTVFMSETIYPIRSHQQCNEYYERVFKQPPPADNVLFARTGGVYRFLVGCYQHNARQMTHRDLSQLIARDERLLCLILLFWEANKHLLDQATHTLLDPDTIPSLDYVTVSSKIALSRLQEWEDLSLILLFPSPGTVQLLIPQDLCEIAKYISQDGGEATLALCSTIWGTGNGGLQAESLVCRHVATPTVGAHQEMCSTHLRLVTSIEGVRHLKLGQNVLPVSPSSVSTLVGKILHVCPADSGLAGFVLVSYGDQISIQGFQTKLGRHTMTITPGIISTQRRNLSQGKKVDDTTLAGIVTKAERGFSKLIDALQHMFPAVTFTPSSFHLITNKQLTAPAKALVQEYDQRAESEPAWRIGGSVSWNVEFTVCSHTDFYARLPLAVRGALGADVVQISDV